MTLMTNDLMTAKLFVICFVLCKMFCNFATRKHKHYH